MYQISQELTAKVKVKKYVLDTFLEKHILLTFITAEHRTACLDEVQKLKTGVAEGFNGENTGSSTPACMATLSLSGVLFDFLSSQ